jgi:hypothetical protein
MDSGVAFDDITTADIIAASYNVSFMGVSGPISFDPNRDYVANKCVSLSLFSLTLSLLSLSLLKMLI